GPRQKPEEPDDRARNGGSERTRHPRMAVVRSEFHDRPRQLDADARADQSARPGATDRRAVLEVSNLEVRIWNLEFRTHSNFRIPHSKLHVSHPPARSLTQTCGGRPAVTCRSG